tara:strand:- start:5060 stop:6061 length:1002 start_codon:yes stop_codon:yes gene_type:complete
MNEIKCPGCGESFKIDDSSYLKILEQVHNQEFEKRVKLLEENTQGKLQTKIDEFKKDHEKEIENLQEDIKLRDTTIERLHSLKAQLSTKMVGETLEQHCEIEFNKLRSTAFPNAYFEKDTDSSTGSQGDYIFRDSDQNGTEIVSIMFEMKNESNTTATKKKNEDFFKELDKDRTEKNCEYAVLVTLLEADNEYYNSGIVDVFHKYPKMYVIRPQFFIPIITLLRNASTKALEVKNQLAVIREKNVDVTKFEEALENFRAGFDKNVATAKNKYQDAIDQIDKSIKNLENTKKALESSERQFRLANDKAQDLTIKRLTKDSPSLAEEFDQTKSIK